MDEPMLTESKWRERYYTRILEACDDEDLARASADATDYDPECSPEDAADDELSCWGE